MRYSASLLTFLMLLSASPRVRVDVYPRSVIVGGTVRITCSVPRDAENRWLEITVPGVTSSTRQLDGEAAPITHTLSVDHLECIAEEALCVVTDSLGKQFVDRLPINVGGCDQ